jgi:predicted lipoprotein with Yx(FWY)xxD motif
MKTQSRQTLKGLRVGSAAAATLALGGLSLSAIVAAPAGAATKAVTVKTVNVAKVGKVLSSGKTLYTLKPSSTPCTAACMKVWPPLVLPAGVTKVTAASGVKGSKFGTVNNAGVRQVTYGGKPLYFFVGDTAAGQAKGNVTDTWGTWTAVTTSKAASSSGGGGSTPSTAKTGGAGF